MEKTVVTNNACSGLIWIAGWLFTIGFLKLAVLKAILAIILWPYYIGAALALVK